MGLVSIQHLACSNRAARCCSRATAKRCSLFFRQHRLQRRWRVQLHKLPYRAVQHYWPCLGQRVRSFSATSQVTGRFLSGQISATSISLSYNGANVSGAKLSSYGPVSGLAGSYSGAITEPTLGVFFTTFVVYPDGVAFLFSVNASNVSAGVGTVSSNGAFSVRTLVGEVISGTFAPSYGAARGTASSRSRYTTPMGDEGDTSASGQHFDSRLHRHRRAGSNRGIHRQGRRKDRSNECKRAVARGARCGESDSKSKTRPLSQRANHRLERKLAQ